MRHKVMWLARLVDSILLSICVITCHWHVSIAWPCAEYFQTCFSAENIIILSLNTVKQSLLWFGYQRWLDVSTDGLFMAVHCLLLFNASVLSNACLPRITCNTKPILQLWCAVADTSILWVSRLRRQCVLCLDYICLTTSIQCPYDVQITVPVGGLRRETLRSSYGFTGIVASTILFNSAQWQIWKKRKPVARRHITVTPYDPRTGTARWSWGQRRVLYCHLGPKMIVDSCDSRKEPERSPHDAFAGSIKSYGHRAVILR